MSTVYEMAFALRLPAFPPENASCETCKTSIDTLPAKGSVHDAKGWRC